MVKQMWERMRARTAAAQSPGYPHPGSGLRHALAVLEAGTLDVGAGRGADARAVPSAGGIHPWETYVVTEEADGPAAFHVDPWRRRCARLTVPRSVSLTLAATGLPAGSADCAHIVVAVRPWLSMREFGDRGYLYSQLDAAHLATNVLGVAGEFGAAELRFRFNRDPLTLLLGLAEGCREVHSVITLRPGGRSWGSEIAGWTMVDERGVDERANPDAMETACWAQLAQCLDESWSGPPVPGSLLQQGFPARARSR